MRRLLLAGAILAVGSALPTTLARGAGLPSSLKDFACHGAVKPAKRQMETVTGILFKQALAGDAVSHEPSLPAL